MSNYFDGYYYKHQKEGNTLCVISGETESERFIQVITNDFAISVPHSDGNCFSDRGILLNVKNKNITISGEITYGKLSPIKYDIMGPFCLLPMECRHGIISMKHSLDGGVFVNGSWLDFSGGLGYIEKDSGRSFPTNYIWIHANDFNENCSVMAAIADIPFMKLKFRGCICIIQTDGREYRLATYLGAKAEVVNDNKFIIRQGRHRLEVVTEQCEGFCLDAPMQGRMTRTIREAASCRARFTFFNGRDCIFDLISENASFENEKT